MASDKIDRMDKLIDQKIDRSIDREIESDRIQLGNQYT